MSGRIAGSWSRDIAQAYNLQKKDDASSCKLSKSDPYLALPKGNRSFRLQVVSPTSRFAYIEVVRLHDQVVSPTRSESIRLHSSRFAYTYKSNCFWKMDEYHCLQLAEESYLTVFPVKFLDIITIMFAGINIVWARLRLILARAARRALKWVWDKKKKITLTLLILFRKS